MDLEEIKKIVQSKIEAEVVTKNVRSKIKSYIHEKQNIREGFKESFESLIGSKDKVKESIDKQQNALIKQLGENQLALTEGLDKNGLAITQGFDKIDDVKKWDLLQLPYEAIEEPEESEREKLKKFRKELYDIKKQITGKEEIDDTTDDTTDDEELRELLDFPTSEESTAEESAAEKPDEKSKVASFDRDYLDRGLRNKQAMDLLSFLSLILPSELMNNSVSKIRQNLEKAEFEIGIYKNSLMNRAIYKKEDGKTLAYAKNENPSPKTIESIEEHNILERYIHNLNQLREFREQAGSVILHFTNPHQLLDRLELLSGSILAGNNQIAHLLNQMKVVTKKQLNDLLKKFILNK